MPRFISESDVKTIRADWWDEDEAVTIKKFSYGDRQKLAGAAVKMNIENERRISEVQIAEMNLMILQIGIVSWTFTRPYNDKAVPVSRHWIEQLDPKDAEFILGEINALNPSIERSADEQEEFRGTDRDGAEA